ncbi:GNAT family N-acetyltransferase [Halopseudomonas sp.]|uniref:GNAT family N-acetyltransferase n=1 Tax=Halopseudomonas sp. TaxID=2901191 RepID=UPI00311E6934
MTSFNIRLASIADAERVGVLFDQYRQFYQQPADLPRAVSYLRARLEKGDSTVLMAQTAEGVLAGFCQLYPSFCSVDAAPICILYDLFVAAEYRQQGIAGALLAAAQQQARELGAVRMELATAISNTSAQRLYEATGWVRDTTFLNYSKVVTD